MSGEEIDTRHMDRWYFGMMAILALATIAVLGYVGLQFVLENPFKVFAGVAAFIGFVLASYLAGYILDRKNLIRRGSA